MLVSAFVDYTVRCFSTESGKELGVFDNTLILFLMPALQFSEPDRDGTPEPTPATETPPSPTGHALAIGLNKVDPAHYGGEWDGELFGCEPDARDMQAIATSQGLNAFVDPTRGVGVTGCEVVVGCTGVVCTVGMRPVSVT